MINKKRGVIAPFLAGFLIAVAFLILMLIVYFLLKKTGFSLLDKIRNLLRWRIK